MNSPSITETIKESVGPGWHPLVFKLHHDLTTLLGEYTLCQCKEKFGGLRYYIDLDDAITRQQWEQARALISEAEQKSFTVCEVCGEPGSQGGNGWIKTRCPKHQQD